MVGGALAWTILVKVIVAHQGPHSKLAEALGSDLKGRVSFLLYAASIPMAFVNEWISDAIFVTVALMWLVPDRRLESRLVGARAGAPAGD